MNVLRTCDTCGEAKPTEDFPFFKKRSDGRQSVCAACKRKERTRTYYERHKDACTSRSLAWRDANREKGRAARRAWRKANPEKMKAESRRRNTTLSAASRELRITYMARYYAENRELVLARQRQKNADNPEKNRKKARAWAAANPERVAERTRKWRADNPETMRLMRRIYRQTRRARNAAAGKPDPAHVERLLRETHCVYCGSAFAPEVRALWLTIDHLVPLVLGGTNASDNLFAACNACNRSKGGRLLSDWKKNPRLGWTPVRGADNLPSSAGDPPR